jgi:hypothetical protein
MQSSVPSSCRFYIYALLSYIYNLNILTYFINCVLHYVTKR